MHERSLVKTMIEQVCAEQRLRGLDRIVEIQLQIGEFSGVDPTLIEIAFGEISVDFWNSPVQLKIERVPLVAECVRCKTTFLVNNFQFACPNCHNGEVELTQGEEVRICHLIAERSQQCQEPQS